MGLALVHQLEMGETMRNPRPATICQKPAPPLAASAGNFLAKAPQPINGKGFEAVYFHDDPQS